MSNINDVLAIIVLYRKEPFESSTYNTLKRAANFIDSPLNLLLYDNSPEICKQQMTARDGNMVVRYIHDGLNPGISSAYNKGVELAREQNIAWLLLLDQDTQIPAEYLKLFMNSDTQLLKKVVCAVPRVLAPGGIRIISPVKIYYGDFYGVFKDIKPGIITRRISGINSGTFLSVAFISGIGGFDRRFPLDMLDHWYFSEIIKANQKVLLLDATIRHNLSVNSFEEEVSLNRYKDILKSERIFYRRNVFSYLVFKIRLLKRLVKQVSYSEKGFFYITLRNLI